jgi:hypothetical protein
MGGGPKPSDSREKPPVKGMASKTTTRRSPAVREAPKSKPAPALPVKKASPTVKPVEIAKSPPAKTRTPIAKSKSPERSCVRPAARAAALPLAKKSLASNAPSLKPEAVPVIEHNTSEFIDISYPPRPGTHAPVRAEKGPAKAPRPLRKKTPAPSGTEEVPGIESEQESAVASVRRIR